MLQNTTARMLGWSGWADSDATRKATRSARRSVTVARELSEDAATHGAESGRDGDGWSRGEAAEVEWLGAIASFLRLMNTV